MGFKCKKCNKKYKSKGGYEKHLKLSNCDQKFTCTECFWEFKYQRHLDRHLNDRVTPCVKKEVSTEFKCDCGQILSSKGNLKRHQETCSYQSKEDKLIQMVENLTKEVSQLKGNITNIDNSTHNTNNITYQTIVLKPYGQEDLEKLDMQAVKHLLLTNPEKYAHSMIAMIHADPNLLEHHNIYYNAVTDEIMVYMKVDNKLTWMPRAIDQTTTELTNKSLKYLTSHPLAQDIPKGSLEENNYANNMHHVLNKQWDTAQDKDTIKQTLGIVTKNNEFLEMIEAQ